MQEHEEEVPEVTSVKPGAQAANTGILRGFDPESGIVSFVYESNGVLVERQAALNKKRPLYSRQYELLISSLGRDGKIPALNFRITIPNDDSLPELLMVQPVALGRRDQKFLWKGTELRWTEELDTAVDIDFDWRAQQFANSFVERLVNGTQSFDPIRNKAFETFKNSAKTAGLNGDDKTLKILFEKNAPKTFTDCMAGNELAPNGEFRSIRYDSRYDFSQQNAHIGNSVEQVSAALANFACQQSVVEYGAIAAAENIGLANGNIGSLAQLHQEELVKKSVLLAGNPNLESYSEIFAIYSHEQVRISLAQAVSGGMDAAGIPAARPEIDLIESDKKHGDPDKSHHLLVMNELPDEVKNNPDPAIRAGAYFACARNLADDLRQRSVLEVGNVQARTAPRRKDLDKEEGQELILATKFKEGTKKLEKAIDLLLN